jgi:hypothetical protein
MIYVTGSRTWADWRKIARWLKKNLKPDEAVVVVDKPGASKLAQRIAEELGFYVDVVPVVPYRGGGSEKKEAKAVEIANKKPVMRRPRRVVGFWDSRETETRDTLDEAFRYDLHIDVIYPRTVVE